MSTNYHIKINLLLKKYPNTIIHINDLVFTQKITILVGDNGAGKSTILKGILGLIQYEGSIECNHTVSYMPENPQFPIDITVQDFLLNLSLLSKNDYNYMPFINEYGLTTKLNANISTLSKGMKAKVNLIQCLMRNTMVYMLDEPLNGLDESSVTSLVSYMRNSSKYFIITSHLKDAFESVQKEVIKIT